MPIYFQGQQVIGMPLLSAYQAVYNLDSGQIPNSLEVEGMFALPFDDCSDDCDDQCNHKKETPDTPNNHHPNPEGTQHPPPGPGNVAGQFESNEKNRQAACKTRADLDRNFLFDDLFRAFERQ